MRDPVDGHAAWRRWAPVLATIVLAACLTGCRRQDAGHGERPPRTTEPEVTYDVILLEVAETEEVGGFDAFRRKILALPLAFDEKEVRFTNLDGDRITFRWKEDGDPTVNGKVPEYGGARFRDPFITSDYDSGVIEVNCAGARAVLHAEHPDAIHREEGNAP